METDTGFDWQDVADNANAGSPLEVIEQYRVIDKGSDEACRYIYNSVDARVNATSDTETRFVGSGLTDCWVDNSGFLWFRAAFFPILSVSAISWATDVAGNPTPQFNTLTPTNVTVYGMGTRKRRIRDSSQDWTFLRRGGRVQATYANGWPNAVLTGNVVAGSTVNLPVDDSTGFAAAGSGQPQNIGATAIIFDGVNTETVTITAVPDGTHVTVASLQFNHNSPAIPGPTSIGLSAVPATLKLGVAFACTHFARFRGSDAVTFIGASGGQKRQSAQPMDALEQAKALWDEFKIRS